MNNAYQSWKLQMHENFSQLNLQEQLTHLLEWGILAANAHNAQSWRCKINLTKSQFDFYLAPEDLLSKTDKVNRQSITSLGCFLENILLVANIFNCKVERLNPSPIAIESKPILVSLHIDTSLAQSPNTEKLILLSAIKERRSNRLKYANKDVPEELVSQIKNKAEQLGLSFFAVKDTVTRLAISELQYMADRTVVALPGFREELLQHLVDNNDSNTTRGMPGYTFGLSDESTQKLKSDLSQKGALNPDWAVGFASAARDGIRSAPLMIVGCGKDNETDWIKAGQLFQHAAVLAQTYGVSTAYNAAMVESLALNSMLKMRLGTLNKPLCIFRMGYPLHEVNHSPRRNLNEIMECVK